MKLAKLFGPIQNGFHDIDQLLIMPIATCFYACNYLHGILVGMKFGKFKVFEVENAKMKIKTLKKSGFSKNMGYIKGKHSKKCWNWSVVVKLLQKSPNSTWTKLCSNKGHFIKNISVKFDPGIQCSSCFMVKLWIIIFETISPPIWKLYLVWNGLFK